MFACIRIVVEERPHAVLVPEAALFRVGGDMFVYRLATGKAVRTPVAIRLRMPGRVEVRSGVSSGMVVVPAGHRHLRAGAAVQVGDGTGGHGPAPHDLGTP